MTKTKAADKDQTKPKHERNPTRKRRKGTSDITITTQNEKGVPHKTIEDKLLTFFEEQRFKNTQIIGLSETNLNWHNPAIYSRIRKLFQYTYVRGHLMTATIPMTTSSNWKPGGKMIGFNRQIVARMIKKGTDKYGRWDWLIIQRTKLTHWALFSCMCL